MRKCFYNLSGDADCVRTYKHHTHSHTLTHISPRTHSWHSDLLLLLLLLVTVGEQRGGCAEVVRNPENWSVFFLWTLQTQRHCGHLWTCRVRVSTCLTSIPQCVFVITPWWEGDVSNPSGCAWQLSKFNWTDSALLLRDLSTGFP